jgi:hypothetical protein
MTVGGVLQNEDAWRHRGSGWLVSALSLQEIDIPAFD